LRLVQPGLITTGGGTLGWTRGDRGTLALDFDADSLNSLDSLLSWVTGSDMTARGDPGDPDNRGVRPLAGAARVLVSLEGSLDSLALQLPGDVWVLERPIELTVTDSTARVSGFSLQSVYGAGKLTFAGDLPTHGRADAHLQLESFPLVGVYALLERDTAGVGGVITAAAGLAGTRADPVSTGTFSVTNGSFGEFHAPFADGTFDYR